MKKKLLLLALTIIVTFALNVSAFAATESPTSGKIGKIWDDLQKIKKDGKDALIEITIRGNQTASLSKNNDYWYGNEDCEINLGGSEPVYLLQDTKTALSINGAGSIDTLHLKGGAIKQPIIIANEKIGEWVKKVDLKTIPADKKISTAIITISTEANDVVKPVKTPSASAKTSVSPSAKVSPLPSACKTASVSPEKSKKASPSSSIAPVANSNNTLPKTGQTDMITIPLILGVLVVLTGAIILISKKRKLSRER